MQEKLVARNEKMTKLAKEMRHWPDTRKIEIFKKYEVMNIKTYKCRNKINLSTVANLDFNKKLIEQDKNKLYEPRLNAQQTIAMHLETMDQHSNSWIANLD
jgi:hypothetical protein